jgi:hypothetical protein
MSYKSITALLTYGAKVSTVEDVYYSPVTTVAGQQLASIYCFLANVTPWPNNVVPTPTQDQYSLKTLMRNMFVAKQVTSSNISPVIRRIDWASGQTYDYYNDMIDMFQVDETGYPVLEFYVKNSYDQVFKCLWNNNGNPSLNEPYFQPGSYSTNNIYEGADGYKWKYIYTVATGDKVNFMDSDWLPVDVGQNTPNPLTTTPGSGSIDVVNVTNGGLGYDPANSAITVTIVGDGTGASANVSSVGANGVIQDIVVNNPGSNYTFANVIFTTANASIGSGATAIAPSSPIGGHGYDPVSELGCRNVMITMEFNDGEITNGIQMIPTDITYYQAGLVINATSLETNPLPANGTIYNTTTQLVVAQGFGEYISNEVVFQGPNLAGATFTGRVVSFNPASDVVSLINTTGTLTYNAPVFGSSSSTVRTLLSSSTPNFVPESGYIAYVENLPGIQRSPDGIEQFKFVLGY